MNTNSTTKITLNRDEIKKIREVNDVVTEKINAWNSGYEKILGSYEERSFLFGLFKWKKVSNTTKEQWEKCPWTFLFNWDDDYKAYRSRTGDELQSLVDLISRADQKVVLNLGPIHVKILDMALGS